MPWKKLAQEHSYENISFGIGIVTLFYQHSTGPAEVNQLRVQSGSQRILTVGFGLVVFKGSKQVESNMKNTSLAFTAPRSRNLNQTPHDKEYIQHHLAGTSPSHDFPFIFGFTPFTPRKRGSLLKKATESACLAVSIIDSLYVTDLGYCHSSAPTSTKAFLAFTNIQEALLVPVNQVQEILNPSNFTA